MMEAVVLLVAMAFILAGLAVSAFAQPLVSKRVAGDCYFFAPIANSGGPGCWV